MGCNYYPKPKNKTEEITELIGGIVFISIIVGCVIMVILGIFN